VIYAFAEFELDVALFQLRRRGEVVKLAPKAFDLLHYLLQHRDRVVAKGELLDELWRGEHVTEAVLPTTVAAIRKALQSGRSRPEAIQTVHGRGYRFVAPVDAREAPGEAPVETGLFVGRDAVMLALRAELDEVLAGRGRVTMLVGEPGIGKTRTAEELAHEARRRGARVAEARCHEGEGVPAFWPWVQILRALVKELPGTRLREQLGAGAADIAPLLPELRQRLPGLPDAVTLDSEQARFRLFDSIALFLLNASRTRPLLLLLDDLHWADEPSLRLCATRAWGCSGPTATWSCVASIHSRRCSACWRRSRTSGACSCADSWSPTSDASSRTPPAGPHRRAWCAPSSR
jgi:DNA-binding winged helix-turn-helix (wHTH) protein